MFATVLGLVAAGVLVGGCGGAAKGRSTTPGTTTERFDAAPQGSAGGALTVLFQGDVDSLDPGVTYYGPGWEIQSAINRTLYSYMPGPDHLLKAPTPDLASGPPVISADRKTVTVKLRSGVRFAPPVNREVTSADVKYAIERAFTKQVANGYAAAYFGDIVGAPQAPGDYRPIPGLQTPNAHELVIHLTRPVAAAVAAALVLPITVPVPKEYAQPFDRQTPSTYARHLAFTGPYMIPHDGAGALTGYRPGRLIELVRNPSWSRDSDYRPAYVDTITVKEGTNVSVGSEQVLAGSNLLAGDFNPAPNIIQQAIGSHPDALQIVPNGGTHYVALNTTVAPLDDIDVRRAIAAVFDRVAMRLTRGGEIAGSLPTGFIPPDFPGYDEAGGAAQGASFDFMKHPRGDLALATSYMRKAGYPSGRYTGHAHLVMVAPNQAPDLQSAQVAQKELAKIGIKVSLVTTTPEELYTRYCGTPKAGVAVCPTMSWAKDYADPESLLDPTFNGKHILPTGNSNYPQLDDPAINRAMAAAEVLAPGPARLKAWADIDRMIISQAAAVPWVWDTVALLKSPQLKDAVNQYTTWWDLSFASVR